MPSRRLQQDVHEDLPAAEDISYESKVESRSAEDYNVTSENIIDDQTALSKLYHSSKKDSEDGKKDMKRDTTFAAKDQITIIENQDETLIKATEDIKNTHNFVFEKKEMDDKLISEVQTPKALHKVVIKEEHPEEMSDTYETTLTSGESSMCVLKDRRVGDGGRRDKAILHMLCVLDGLLDVLVKGVKLVEFLLNLVSSHEWLGLSTQPTPREVDSNGFELLGGISFKEDRVGVVYMEVSSGIVRARLVSRVVVKVMLMVLIGWEVEELALEAMEYDDQGIGYEEGCLQVL
ncbi:hypothetical protein Tco_1360727 [Tanacetum coccineum]